MFLNVRILIPIFTFQNDTSRIALISSMALRAKEMFVPKNHLQLLGCTQLFKRNIEGRNCIISRKSM